MIKDSDSAELAFKLRAGMFGVVIAGMCVVGGVIIGFYAGTSIWIAVAIGVVLGVVVYFLSLAIADRAGAAGASIFSPSGASTRSPLEYSLADSLAARGQLTEAAEAYELLSEDYPDDPEPRVRRARLLRDRMSRPEDAAEWFRKALAAKQLDTSNEAALLKELCELFMYKLKTPNKALPYLAQLSEKHAQHPSAKWAKEEAAALKQVMQEGMNG